MIWSVVVILHLQLWIFLQWMLCLEVTLYLHKYCVCIELLYSLNQTPQLLFVELLFKSGARAVFVLLSQSICWRSREQSSMVEWLLDRQRNLLVVADWFTSLFWVRFAIFLWRVFACPCATQVFIAHTAATIQLERHFFRSAHVELRLLCKSCY